MNHEWKGRAEAACAALAAVSEDVLAAHVLTTRYGDFELTSAIRPALGLPVIPREGYRHGRWDDRRSGRRSVPMLEAAVSKEKLFDCFLDLLVPLGDVVDVILKSTHEYADGAYDEFWREEIDRAVLTSMLCDHERLLLDDGYAGISVCNFAVSEEVQFDDHKLFVIYADAPRAYVAALEAHGVPSVPGLRVLADAEHYHLSWPDFQEEFADLCRRLGATPPP